MGVVKIKTEALDALTIVVFCNKRDFYLTRICIGSIRYFYPEIKILIVKDEINGKFSTKEIEKIFNIEIYDCGKKKYGWAASKTFFLLQANDKCKYLLLDSDTVFIEPFLERVFTNLTESGFAISADYYNDINTKHINETYFNVSDILKHDPEYEYPGFFFNTGQLFITGGLIKIEHLADYFDVTNFPHWKRLDIFPLVDQSVYNYVFPKLSKIGVIELQPSKFMIWSEGKEAQELDINDIIVRKGRGGLIHWAGAKRTPHIEKMSRADILLFFQNEYYKKVSFGKIILEIRKIVFEFNSNYLKLKSKFKRVLDEKIR